MSRPLRIHVPDLPHHVFARGDDKRPIFADDEDYAAFLHILSATAPRFDIQCAAYCLLPNHYHLLLVPRRHPVSRLMQQVNSTYCQRFNRRHEHVGHVLQGRFGCRIVEGGEYARTVLRYIALNPVAAGLARAPEDWRWSSYRAVLGDEPSALVTAEHVWAAFRTSDPDVGRARFRDFIDARLEAATSDHLLDGSDRLRTRMAPSLEPYFANPDFVYAHRCAARPSLGALLEGCEHERRAEDAAHTAFHRHGYTLAEIGRALGRDASTVCRWIQRAAARQTAVDAVPPGEDTDARNKI